MAKVRKTPQDQRGTYKLVDGNGKVIQELRPGENGITEWHIKKMHQMDDLDVVNYYKNARPNRTEEEKAKIKEWETEYIQRFKSRHGYEPHPSDVKEEINEQFPRNYSVSLNAYDDECEEGKNPIQKAIYDYSIIGNENPKVDRLREVMLLLTEEQRWLIKKIYFDGVSQVDIAKELGVKPPAITNRLAKIHKRLKKLF